MVSVVWGARIEPDADWWVAQGRLRMGPLFGALWSSSQGHTGGSSPLFYPGTAGVPLPPPSNSRSQSWSNPADCQVNQKTVVETSSSSPFCPLCAHYCEVSCREGGSYVYRQGDGTAGGGNVDAIA